MEERKGERRKKELEREYKLQKKRKVRGVFWKTGRWKKSKRGIKMVKKRSG